MGNIIQRYDPAILKQLPAIVKAYQLPDTRKAVIQMLNSFLPFVAIWIAMYFLLDISFWLVLPLAAVNAFFLVRIFIIQHDCGHQSFTTSRKANDIIGQVCSFLSFIPYRYWAKGHNFHHGHNGILWEHRDIGDIELLTVTEFKALPRWRKLKYAFFRSAPILFIVGPIWYIFLNGRLPMIRLKGWEHAHRALWMNNILLLFIHAGIAWALGFKAFLLIQLPIVALFGIIAIWFFYVQHQHETAYKQWKDKWDYIVAAVQGSTYYKLPLIGHWLTGNIGFHHIHHLCPSIPNYNLRACHKENPVFEKHVNRINFWQSLKTINANLWDAQREKMVSFSEYKRNRKLAKAGA